MILRPFHAVRPAPERAEAIASPPYDVLTTSEARALAAGHPDSLLHVTRPEIDLDDAVDPHSDAAYAAARDAWLRMRANGALVREETPSLYAYRLRRGTHTQVGIGATFAVSELENGVIKPHERTRRDKEDDRTRHIETVAAQTGPVFLAYRAHHAVDALVTSAVAAPPLYDFVAGDGIGHTLWRSTPATTAALVELFAREIPAAYIADGHHRAAAARRVAANAASSDDDRRFFLGVAFPDEQLAILPYHRTVRDLGGRTPADFVAAVGALPNVRDLQPQAPPPGGVGRVSMYVGGTWYGFRLAVEADGDPVRSLDTQALQDIVLEPLLDIRDPRADARIDFMGGIHGTDALRTRVDRGDAAVAFALHPLSMESLLRVADAGAFLPPKSTWFEPKLRDGLLVHAFER